MKILKQLEYSNVDCIPTRSRPKYLIIAFEDFKFRVSRKYNISYN